MVNGVLVSGGNKEAPAVNNMSMENNIHGVGEDCQ